MEKEFILIHGAWHGGWCWEGVETYLKAQGFMVSAPTLPGHNPDDKRGNITMEDYIQAVITAVDGASGPVVLVGHSSAGFLLQSAAAQRAEKIAHLIFINAFVLPHGKSQFDLVPPEVAAGMIGAAGESPDNCVPIMEDFIRSTLMSGDTKADQDRVIDRLVPQPLALFTTPVNLEGFDPDRFEKALLFCSKDQSLPEGAYLGMAKALGNIEIIALDLDHEGIVTHPDQVGAALAEAVS
jgi:pimeloyl-ACP methyl ester carboxylesterase